MVRCPRIETCIVKTSKGCLVPFSTHVATLSVSFLSHSMTFVGHQQSVCEFQDEYSTVSKTPSIRPNFFSNQPSISRVQATSRDSLSRFQAHSTLHFDVLRSCGCGNACSAVNDTSFRVIKGFDLPFPRNLTTPLRRTQVTSRLLFVVRRRGVVRLLSDRSVES